MEVPHFGKKSWVYCTLVTSTQIGYAANFLGMSLLPRLGLLQPFYKNWGSRSEWSLNWAQKIFQHSCCSAAEKEMIIVKSFWISFKVLKIVLNQFWTRSCKMAGGIECLKRIWSDKKMWWWKKTHVLGLFTLNTHGPNPESKFFSKSF